MKPLDPKLKTSGAPVQPAPASAGSPGLKPLQPAKFAPIAKNGPSAKPKSGASPLPAKAATAGATPVKQPKSRTTTGLIAALTLVDLALADKVITAFGIALALGTSTFAVNMINRNLHAPVMLSQRDETDPRLIRWKQPINVAQPPEPKDANAALVAKSRNIDFTPLGSLPAQAPKPAKPRVILADPSVSQTTMPPEQAPVDPSLGKVAGYSLVIAGNGTAVLEGRRGFMEVRVGTYIDADHEVLAIREQGNGWVVVTNQGTISTLAR